MTHKTKRTQQPTAAGESSPSPLASTPAAVAAKVVELDKVDSTEVVERGAQLANMTEQTTESESLPHAKKTGCHVSVPSMSIIGADDGNSAMVNVPPDTLVDVAKMHEGLGKAFNSPKRAKETIERMVASGTLIDPKDKIKKGRKMAVYQSKTSRILEGSGATKVLARGAR
jgi:hypothetical protein